MYTNNDPLGQIHNPASSDHYSHLKIVSLKSGRTNNMCENSDHYRLWQWVGLVDQQDWSRQLSTWPDQQWRFVWFC